MEFYATAQELVVWTKSTLLPEPTYDAASKKWSIAIDHDGTEVRLRPSHIILAAGAVGPPRIPRVPGLETFNGTVLHSSEFQGAALYKGKRVIVVGAGNSSADICQDSCSHEAESVTMIQRSCTGIMKNDVIMKMTLTEYPESEPTEISDFKKISTPRTLLKEMLLEIKDPFRELHQEIYDGLRSRGFKLPEYEPILTLTKFHESYGGELVVYSSI